MDQGRVYLNRRLMLQDGSGELWPEVELVMLPCVHESVSINCPGEGMPYMLTALWAADYAHEDLYQKGLCYVSDRWNYGHMQQALDSAIVSQQWVATVAAKTGISMDVVGMSVTEALRRLAAQFLAADGGHMGYRIPFGWPFDRAVL